MSTRLERIQNAVERACDSTVEHVDSVPLREVFRGEVVWEGVVEVFAINKPGTAKRAYGWCFDDEKGETQYVAVLELPPVKSPETAVRAYISSLK